MSLTIFIARISATKIHFRVDRSKVCAEPLIARPDNPENRTMFLTADLTIILTLRDRPDRQRDTTTMMDRIGHPIDGDAIRFQISDRPKDPHGFPSIGAYGCFCSHLEAFKTAARENARRLLILEDDILFKTADTARLSALSDEFQTHPFAMAYGGFQERPIGSNIVSDHLIEAPAASPIVLAHCVMFDGGILPDLVAYLEAILTREPGDPIGGPMHVDGAYNHFRKDHPHLRTLAVDPPIAFQRSSASDIAVKRIIDRTPLLKNLTAASRRVKNYLKN